MPQAKRWAWAPHEDGPWDQTFDSREAAEEYGRHEAEGYDAEGLGWVGEVEEIDPEWHAAQVVDVEALLDQMDQMGDLPAVFDEEVFSVSESRMTEAREALEEALGAWAAEYVTAGGKYLIGEMYEVKE